MSNSPRQPESRPASKSGLKDGEGAPPPPSDAKQGGPKRPVAEEDVFGGAERTHARATPTKGKP